VNSRRKERPFDKKMNFAFCQKKIEKNRKKKPKKKEIIHKSSSCVARSGLILAKMRIHKKKIS
jgi:hypothetical protein